MHNSLSCFVRRPARFVLPVVCLASLATVRAQCATEWTPGDSIPGVDGAVRVSTMWDPDGAGPLTARLVIGGAFQVAGTVVGRNIAAWDPATGAWSGFGSGTDGAVTALAVHPSGDLIAAGSFANAGGVGASRIARWNGTSWSALGSGVNALVNAVTALPNGDIVAGGEFMIAGGVSMNRIGRWNGTSWSGLGTGMDNVVYTLTTMPNGDVVAGGWFDVAGGVTVKRVARWDGTSWSALGAGVSAGTPGFPQVRALLVLPNGDLVVAGDFFITGVAGSNNIARWDGSTWSAFGNGAFAGTDGALRSVTRMMSGDLVVAGRRFNSGSPTYPVQRWNGTVWSQLGVPADFTVDTLATLPSGEVFAGGAFWTIDDVPAARMAKWFGAWSAIGAGTDHRIRSVTRMPNGDLVAGGYFRSIGGVAANYVARWNGTTWSPLGSGTNGVVIGVKALANGDVIAGGWFTTAGGAPANYIARWNGTAWSPMGSGMNGSVQAITQLPNGHVVAGGTFSTAGGVGASCVAGWNGSSWYKFGTGTCTSSGWVFGSEYSATVRGVLALPNGDLVVSGNFVEMGGTAAKGLVRWNGSSWATYGTGPTAPSFPVWTVAPMSNGDLVAAGQFTGVGEGVARWNGTSWTQLMSFLNAPVFAITELPDGDLLAGGFFQNINGAAHNRVARLDGATWSVVDGGVNNNVHAFLPLPNGDVVAAGEFTATGDHVSAYIGRLTTTCPAGSTDFGTGCTGSGGDNRLTATTLPWIDSTFRATGTGLPTVSIVLTLTSVTPIAPGAVPLTLAFSQAGAGCDVLTMPDLLGFVITTNGVAQSELFLPNTSPLVGIPFYHQMVPIEVDANGAWPSVVATNALQLTAGSL